MPRREIVPGDAVRLSSGDLVPADARLIAARDLFVQQAALTGESLPVEKEAAPDNPALYKNPSAPNMLFLGTSIVSGTGTALVIATGPRTTFGDIAAKLAERPAETEFERGLRRFGSLILRVIFFMVLFILVMSLALRHNAFESLLFAVALAVGLTPEFLPMITSVILANGAVQMSKHKVIVKHLAAIQNFGSIDVFCSDKTGTLTAGIMKLESNVDPAGAASDWVLTLAWLNSKYQTGIRSPLDAELVEHTAPGTDGYTLIDEIPFDFERRRVSVVVEHAGANGPERLLIAKGAPEGMLPLCTQHRVGEATLDMDAGAATQARQTYEKLSAQGNRVLGVAYVRVPQQAKYSKEDEKGLVLAGFVAFSDPILPDTVEAVAEMKRDGVQVKILTGDNDLVARRVCGEVGIEGDRVVTGDEIEAASDAALGHLVEAANVFARVAPAQKHRIILALRDRDTLWATWATE